MARQLGLLERARLEQEFDQARKRAEKLRILHSLGLAIASEPDLEQVLTRIVEAAVFITEAEEGSLLLLDEETDELHLRAQKGLGDKYARGFRIPVQDTLAGEVLRMGKAQNLTGAEGSVKVVTGYLVNAILYVPVAIKGRAIGVLAVDNQSSAAPFSEDDEGLLLVLAGYAAIALENARRLEESERRFQTLAALHGVGGGEGGWLLEADVDRILVGDPTDLEAPQALTPDYLSTVIGPCLRAITDLQCILDELARRPSCEVTVLAITQDWPVPVSLAGATEALQAIQGMILPWADEYVAGKKEVAIELALDLLAGYRSGLRDTELIAYVTRLLPLLETFLSCPLQVSVGRGD
jgi:GAF domain-containing protein